MREEVRNSRGATRETARKMVDSRYAASNARRILARIMNSTGCVGTE